MYKLNRGKPQKEATTMTIRYSINNYALGAKLRTCPTECIISQERVDKGHTEVTFQFSDDRKGENQKAFTDKVLAKKGIRI